MADVSIDTTSFQEALKYKFSPDRLKLMGYRDNPWYALCPKKTDLGGRSFLLPMYHTAGRGKGTNITYSKLNQTEADLAQFVITRTKLYSVAEVEREALKASVGNPHSWLEARTALMEERVYEMTRDIALDMYGDGSGNRGTIGSLVLDVGIDGSTAAADDTLIKLANPEDIVAFERGMFIGAVATADPGGAVKDGDYFEILAIDRDKGWFVVDGQTDVTTAWVATDYLVEQGDAQDTGAYKKLRGLSAWIPATAPATGDSFYNVDRSVDPTRLAGIRYDGSAQSVHEAIIDAGTAMFREGGKAKIVLANPVQVAEVAKSLQGQAIYEPVKSSDGVVSFESLRVRTGAGTVRLVSDPNCPIASAFMLDPAACCLHSLGETIEMIDEDGQVLLRSASDDTFEVRFAFYGAFYVKKPKDVCHITLGT